MPDLKLSADGLYYWDGSRWVATLSPDGHWRWTGSAWVPATGMVAPPMQYYPQPQPTQRVPTRWTGPMQFAVAGLAVLHGLYSLSWPFWMAGAMSNAMNQAFQQQAVQDPYATPPPPEIMSSLTSMMTAMFWVSALIVFAIATVIFIGALKRWTWMFYAVLVLSGFVTIGLPFNLVSAALGRSAMNPYGFSSWFYALTVGIAIPVAALFVWMLIVVIRTGPWAMTRKIEVPAAPVPAT